MAESCKFVIHRRTFRVLIFAFLFAALGACVDLYYVWPEKVPGDPASTLHTIRHSVGLQNGLIMRATHDDLDYESLGPSIQFSVHAPAVRGPIGFAIYGFAPAFFGVAPWFVVFFLAIPWAVLRLISAQARSGTH
jgi:hypothetical protein